jgi:1,4-alpha-glucan branching enzyme
MDLRTTFVLNTHMPRVLGVGGLFEEPENWLFEAITETYIPLFRLLDSFEPARFAGRLVLSFTPCLLDQLLHGEERYLDYLAVLQRIADRELERTGSARAFDRHEKYPQRLSAQDLARVRRTVLAYRARLDDSRRFVLETGFARQLRALARRPGLELWTSSPEHNFLPFFRAELAERFVRSGLESFEARLGRPADGFWLPECAFYPGLERVLLRAGVRRVALSLHAIGAQAASDKSGVYRHGDLEVLVHDYRLARYLWKSPDSTFPAHGAYREFYRDLGFDVAPSYFDELGLAIGSERRGKVWTGFKYHAITGEGVDLGQKAWYDPDQGRAQALAHGAEMWQKLEEKRELLFDRRHALLALDTEILGHWWHEGVDWLRAFLAVGSRSGEATPSEPVPPRVPHLHYSTWGRDFYSEHWLIPANAWMFGLLKLVEANVEASAAPAAWTAFERFAASDHLFMYPDPSQQERARARFLELFDIAAQAVELRQREIVTSFPVDPFKSILLFVTDRELATPPVFELQRLRGVAELPVAPVLELEPEHRRQAGYSVYYQFFLFHPESRLELRVAGAAPSPPPHRFTTPGFGMPLLTSSQLQVQPKYDPDRLRERLAELWREPEPVAPPPSPPPARSRTLHRREQLARVLGGRKVALFKYNKEGYALVRFARLAPFELVAVFDDTHELADAGAYVLAGPTGVPVVRELEAIERLDWDALVLTCSLNFESEVEPVRRLLARAVREGLPVVSLYDDILAYDLIEGPFDPALFHRVAVDDPLTLPRVEPSRYRQGELLAVFGTDTVQGKFTTQLYLREALAPLLDVKHHATEPTGILLGADSAFSRLLNLDEAERLARERGLMQELLASADLVLTGGQNSLVFHPPGSDRSANASTLIFNTFWPRWVVLTASVDSDLDAIAEAFAYLEELAAQNQCQVTVLAFAMLAGRKLQGGRWTETYFLEVAEEQVETTRARLEARFGLPVFLLPDESASLAREIHDGVRGRHARSA